MARYIRFELSQEGKQLGSCSVMEQAINAAKYKVAVTGKPVTVTAFWNDVTRKPATVVYHPDGHVDRLWNFERSAPFYPTEGATYRNQGGGEFRCIKASSVYHDAWMINVKSGWAFTAHGCRIYSDGSIEWDYSTGGHFEKEVC